MSMRWDSALVERLQRRAAGTGSSVSALAQRDVEERGEAALGAAADAMGLDVAAVRVAARHHGTFPDEASAMIEGNERAAEEAYRAWVGQQQLLA